MTSVSSCDAFEKRIAFEKAHRTTMNRSNPALLPSRSLLHLTHAGGQALGPDSAVSQCRDATMLWCHGVVVSR